MTEDVPDGYTASASGQTGTIVHGTAAVTFVNTCTTPEGPENPGNLSGPDVPTGDDGALMLYGGFAALFAAGLLVTLFLGYAAPGKRSKRGVFRAGHSGHKQSRPRGGKRLMR